MSKVLTPGSVVHMDGKDFTFLSTEKRGRWEYAILKDTKGKKHEALLGKVQTAFNEMPETPAPAPTNPAPVATKENTMAEATSTPRERRADGDHKPMAEKEPKAPKPPKEPKAPRVRKDISNDPMALGFQKFREAHPPKLNETLGRKIQDKGDEVAAILERELAANGDDIFACPTVVANLPVAELRTKYANLNKGMQRMNIGNRLRGILTPSPEKQAREVAKAEAKLKRDAEKDEKAKAKQAEKDQRIKDREAKAAQAKAEKEAKAAKKAEPKAE